MGQIHSHFNFLFPLYMLVVSLLVLNLNLFALIGTSIIRPNLFARSAEVKGSKNVNGSTKF